MSRNRKRTPKSYGRKGYKQKSKMMKPGVSKPQNKPKTRRGTNQERVTPKNGKDRLIRLFVALPEDEAVRLLAATRMYYGSPDVPLFGKYANQVVLWGIDKIFRDLENTYAYSQFWQGLKDCASEEIRGVK